MIGRPAALLTEYDCLGAETLRICRRALAEFGDRLILAAAIGDAVRHSGVFVKTVGGVSEDNSHDICHCEPHSTEHRGRWPGSAIGPEFAGLLAQE
jgi:hypothetical protein